MNLGINMNKKQLLNPQLEVNEIIDIITKAKDNALIKVNEELITMYLLIGKILSTKSKDTQYGDKYIDEIMSPLVTQVGGNIKFKMQGA